MNNSVSLKTKPKSLKGFSFIAVLFILPALILSLVFYLYPLLNTIVMSFYNVPMLGERTFIGFSNYTNLFDNQEFGQSLWFTLKYIIMVTPPIFIAGLILALLVNTNLPFVSFFRSVFFLPDVISLVSVSLIWLWGYNDLYGFINYYLVHIGLIDHPIAWMSEANTSLPAICFMVTWKVAGFTMIILLSSLQTISSDIYEAAKIDGANRWQNFKYITLPLLKPAIVLALVISVIGSALAFEQFVIMTGGGPSHSTTTIVHLIFDTSFKYNKFGYGASMSVVLLVLLLILSVLQVKAVSKK
jgi:multiple sugar transport system permease protein